MVLRLPTSLPSPPLLFVPTPHYHYPVSEYHRQVVLNMPQELKYAGHQDGAERVEVVDGTSSSDTSDVLEPTREEQAAVIRKLDRRLLPFVLVLYSFAILDRSNLGNAKLAGLTKSIDLGGLRYNWLGKNVSSSV